MIVGVADTHAAIWYIFNDPRLSSTAKAFIENTAANGNQIGMSSITLVEIVYLIEKGKVAAETLTRLANALNDPDSVLMEIPPDLSIARTLSRIDMLKVPDMPDRIIAATALNINVPLISRDAKIKISGIATLW